MKKVLLVFFLLLNGYVFIIEYSWYRGSTLSSGDVSHLQVTPSAERRLLDSCDHFRGREDCSTLYEYDVTWRAGGNTWTWHVEKARTPPGAQICMNVVASRPDVAKPCDNWFFIKSRIPPLLAVWGVLAFIALTWLIHRVAVSRRSGEGKRLYRVCTTRRELLLETDDLSEAQRFIGNQYRVCATFRSQEILRQGHKKTRVECISWHVRRKKGP